MQLHYDETNGKTDILYEYGQNINSSDHQKVAYIKLHEFSMRVRILRIKILLNA